MNDVKFINHTCVMNKPHTPLAAEEGREKMEIVPLQQNICYQIAVVLEVAVGEKKLAE